VQNKTFPLKRSLLNVLKLFDTGVGVDMVKRDTRLCGWIQEEMVLLRAGARAETAGKSR
jgi:hypothetical protein